MFEDNPLLKEFEDNESPDTENTGYQSENPDATIVPEEEPQNSEFIAENPTVTDESAILPDDSLEDEANQEIFPDDNSINSESFDEISEITVDDDSEVNSTKFTEVPAENSTDDPVQDEDLQSSDEDLQSSDEEQQSSDEEQQSSDEEQQSSDEEQQSSDEEQQSSDEEQQSSDENTTDEAATTESTNEEAESAENKPIPYHERYYLKYREGKRSTPLDLSGTLSFLHEIGFDGGELRQAREGKNAAESFKNSNKDKNNQMFCSYCGTEIAGVEYFRLPDGRLRCTNCSKTVVKSKTEANELCQRVIANMDNFFGATIDVPVSIEIVDERKLKKKVGLPLGTKDEQSMLILGVAINKKKKYSIILENGAPRISLIATFAHELTHIWQYTHWDNKKNFPKCPKSKRLLIYEGMAKWVEIQYLYMIGETNVAKREEFITRNRQDEYGIGFCLYEDRYPLSREVMTCEDTPFTSDRYPFD